ncbi:GatB/YqeY domain-containing protein [Rhizobium laguerreae]|uniref:GatB/YqeY domain-containing protein n=1 Tax=Rhizobium laguerreae TaxID=1076926 RepID=UPI001C927EE2|nr:GatB/YqeY domain-containing protein [Rhizobium laguerreae]MBY3155508.1 GatB/YqeY domain-containing protein [Rhizobium laguerreae]
MTTKTELHDRIKADIDTAFRAGEKHRTDVLKTLISDAVTLAKKDEDRLPTNIEIVALLRKFIANAATMAAAFDKDGRAEKASLARAEIVILTGYLPPEVSADDIRAFLEGLKASGDIAIGPKGLGDAVKALKAKYGDAFDGKTMTPIAKEVVAG